MDKNGITVCVYSMSEAKMLKEYTDMHLISNNSRHVHTTFLWPYRHFQTSWG